MLNISFVSQQNKSHREYNSKQGLKGMKKVDNNSSRF